MSYQFRSAAVAFTTGLAALFAAVQAPEAQQNCPPGQPCPPPPIGRERPPLALTGEAPTNLVARASGGTIVLTWTGTADAQGYRVFRALSESGSFSELTSAPITATEYTDEKPPRATLWYKVAAEYGGNVNPGYTDPVPVTREGPTYTGPVPVGMPSGRTSNVTAMPLGAAPDVEVHQDISQVANPNDLSIYWGTRDGAVLLAIRDATGFAIARAKQRDGPWVDLPAQPPDAGSLVDAGAHAALMPDETVFYRVIASYAGKTPGKSTPAPYTRATRPTENLKAAASPSIGTVKLTWQTFHRETQVFRNGKAITTSPVTGVWIHFPGPHHWLCESVPRSLPSCGVYRYEFSDKVAPGTHTYQVAPLFQVTGKGLVAGDLAKQPSVSVTVKARPELKCPPNEPNCHTP